MSSGKRIRRPGAGGSAMSNLLPDECFDPHPGKRLHSTREYVASLSGEDCRRLEETLREKLTFRHRAYAFPAWGLMVLPGPSGEPNDPTEPHCDWTPGLGETSKHFAEFPTYINGEPAERTWQRMRKVIRKVVLPGVKICDRFACWGVINLTTEHAWRETYRRTTEWDMGTPWKVIEACRPALIIAPTSQEGDARCYERVQQLLRDKGSSQNQGVTRYPGDQSGRTWDFHWWETAWGYCRVGKMHNQPYIWGAMVTDLLTEEACRIAAKSN